jgi:hypothetical protein
LTLSQNEKRQLSHQLSDVLDRRQQIEEVKLLVQDLRKERRAAAVAAPSINQNPGMDRGVGVGVGVGASNDQDCMMIHTIHHATSGRNRLM